MLPPAIGTIISIVAGNIGAAIGGDSGRSDRLRALPVPLRRRVSCGACSSAILPTLLQLVTQILKSQPKSPLPDGIPAVIGIQGQRQSWEYGKADVQPRTVYRVNYSWITF